MKTNSRIIGVFLAACLGTAVSYAQSTAGSAPAGTPAGSAATGSTNSGGVSATKGKPSDAPSGKSTDGTGSGTTAPTPAGAVSGGETPAGGPGSANPHTPNEHASDKAKAVQAVLATFDAKRDQAIADRKVLIEKLKAAQTDTERDAILAQLRAENRAQKDEQSALGKEIRDELKKLRGQHKTGG